MKFTPRSIARLSARERLLSSTVPHEPPNRPRAEADRRYLPTGAAQVRDTASLVLAVVLHLAASISGSRSRGCCPGRGIACTSARPCPSQIPDRPCCLRSSTIFSRSAARSCFQFCVIHVDLAVLGRDVTSGRTVAILAAVADQFRRLLAGPRYPDTNGKYFCGSQPVAWQLRHSGSKCRGGSR